MDEWVSSKLSLLTLEEKAFMLSGVDVWRTHGVPRLGIPQLKAYPIQDPLESNHTDNLQTSDGPIGIRGGTMVDGTTAAMAPSAVSLSATWDLDIISKLGDLLATEMRDKKADILLAPTGVLDLALMHSALPPLS
jgi:beta-glucosidase